MCLEHGVYYLGYEPIYRQVFPDCAWGEFALPIHNKTNPVIDEFCLGSTNREWDTIIIHNNFLSKRIKLLSQDLLVKKHFFCGLDKKKISATRNRQENAILTRNNYWKIVKWAFLTRNCWFCCCSIKGEYCWCKKWKEGRKVISLIFSQQLCEISLPFSCFRWCDREFLKRIRIGMTSFVVKV